MTDYDTTQQLKSALALTTSLLHAPANDWTEPYRLARELDDGAGPEVMMALAHFTIAVLRYASELAAAAETEGVAVAGVPGGVTPATLLQEIGRQIIDEEASS